MEAIKISEDDQRETRIELYFKNMTNSLDRQDRKHWADKMTKEINNRSKEQIERMERRIK